MNRRRLNRLIWLGIAAFVAVVAPTQWGAPVEGRVADALSPLVRFSHGVRTAGVFPRIGRRDQDAGDGSAPGATGSAPDRVRELERENRALRAAAARLSEVQAENDRLLSLLSFREEIPFDVAGARVIGRDSAQWWHTILIDAGRTRGVERQMPVLADGGLLGRTTDQIGHQTARVLLLVDPNSRAGAMLSRTRTYGLLEGVDQRGDRQPTCRMRFVSRYAHVEIGEPVVSSGLGGVYPAGIPIGSVVGVGPSEDGLYQILSVELFADAEHAEEVLVVLSGDRPWLP